MDVPYDWILDDVPPADFNYVVIYPEPTSSVPISELDALVDIRVNPTNQTLDEMADEMDTLARNFSNTAVRVTEINTNDYYLGGHPAIRSVAVGNLHFGSQNATEKKAVSYDTIIDGKHYALSEEAKVDLYPEFEPIFQRMVESFRAIELDNRENIKGKILFLVYFTMKNHRSLSQFVCNSNLQVNGLDLQETGP